MWTRSIKMTGATLGASLGLLLAAPTAHAQFGDLSPVLLVESGPSDNAEYRRMVFVKFNGAATPLSQIRSFQRAEARAKRSGKPAEVVRFCIKNVQGWEGGNRVKYLDPIFEGMPHAASLNN